MGNNLNVIGDMKSTILQALLTDEDIVKLITNSASVTLPDLSLRYTQVVPWKAVPATQSTAQTFVTFDVTSGKAKNCVVKDYSLYIWIMTHESLMPFGNKEGTALGLSDRGVRVDILADKIDYLINGSSHMGFGELVILDSRVFDPVDGYHGRSLTYSISGWNRMGDRL